jgi:nucleoside diphosphate kinase
MPPMDDPASWTDRVFCLITPDCLRRHLTNQVLDRFAHVGLRVARWRLAQITAAQLDMVAELDGAKRRDVYKYRAVDALFELGPTLQLVLADQDGRPGAELYATIQAIKGHSDPALAPEGSLRRHLKSVNEILDLLHVSDTPERSAIECGIFAGSDPGLFTDAEFAPALALIEAGQPIETRPFTAVLAGIRARLLGQLWSALTPPGRQLATDLHSRGELGDPKAGMLIAEHLEVHGDPVGLGDILAARFDGSAPRLDMADVRARMAVYGLTLDPWEFTVLATSSHFEPAR